MSELFTYGSVGGVGYNLGGNSGGRPAPTRNLTTGITVPQSGRVETDGVEVSALGDAERRDFIRRLGLVFQDAWTQEE